MYYLALIITQILFGLNFPISKEIVMSIDPIKWAAIRFLLSGLILLIVTLIFRKKRRPSSFKKFFFYVIPVGILGILCGQTFIMIGLKYTASSNGAIITGLIPILAIIITFFKTGEKLSRKKIMGISIAFLGTIIITLKSGVIVTSESLMGDFFVLLGAVCVASYFSMGKFLVKQFDHFWVTSFMLLSSGLVLLPYYISTGGVEKEQIETLYPEIVFSIVGATLVTYFLSNISLKKVSANTASLFIYLQPIVATIAGYFLLAEKISPSKVIAFVLIVTGVVLCLEKREKGQDN